jgi:succinylglutamic semialdehyde dehydrogenase
VDFLETLVEAARQVRTGPPEADPPAFYGPLIRRSAVEVFLREQEALKARGGVMWLEGKALGGAGNFVSPGIWEVNPEVEPDAEIFAPLLRVVRVKDLSAAIEAANSTRYGLAAALLSTHAEDWARAQVELRAGVLNWNQPTTAATSAAPFGGIGLSGNHRPSAYFAVDYCAYPVAILESPQPSDGPWPPGLLPA